MYKRDINDNRGLYSETVGKGRLESVEDSTSLSSDLRSESKRILIVDDNSDIILTLRMGLEDNDATMEVYCYNNPVNALLDFKPDFYDLLLRAYPKSS
jgi:PleD family two-component response regulator